jgi:hypothetical protein
MRERERERAAVAALFFARARGGNGRDERGTRQERGDQSIR